MLKKAAVFTDIHFGKKANSETHNLDCLAFIDWFCSKVQEDPKIDHIIFLGDWNENRSALNISTLNFSYQGAKKLNSLGLPILFIVGNHDLYHRHTRAVHSVIPFHEFKHFILVEEPTIFEAIGPGGALLCPYLFHEEYADLTKFLNIPFWAGHFEFRGFQMTGNGGVMPVGPDPKLFKGPRHIVSGHFHKRQADGNIVYIGNAFPMDFGDAGDTSRGMMTYDHIADEMLFYDWPECPTYVKTRLTDILDSTIKLNANSRVKCVVDVPISFEESTTLRTRFTKQYNLREFTFEESAEIREAMTDTETSIDWENKELASVDDLVEEMLSSIDSQHFNNDTLLQIYRGLQPT